MLYEVITYKIRQIDGTKVTTLIWQKPLLATRVGRLKLSQLRGHVGLVGGIDKEYPRLAVMPGKVDDLFKP